MQIAGFEFSDGARFQPGAPGDANAVGTHIELLRERCKGELTPQDILDDARHNNSPLHAYFEWSDTAAAEAYRLQQARGLIRAVVAIYTQPDRPAQRMKAYVHIPEKGAPHYRETGHAMSQANTRRMVLERAWREFQAWKARYKDLREFSDLFEVADAVEKKLPKPSRR
jgi:hypothetical protein